MQLDPELEPHLVEASRLNNLDPNLMRALLGVESSSNPNTPPSTKGAVGIAQFLPETAERRGIDPHDPVQAIYGAADLLNENLTKAEQIRAGGRDINPTAHALRMYFGGDEGPQWGPNTANYPNLIWGRYKELAGGNYPKIGGDSQPVAATDVDGPAPVIPKSAPGQYLSVPGADLAKPQQPATAPLRFDIAGGDSFAAQQLNHPGMGGLAGPQFSGPGTPLTKGVTASVGAPAKYITDTIAINGPETYGGKTVFWSSGASNARDPRTKMVDVARLSPDISAQFDALQGTQPSAVAVMPVGPGVRNNQDVNAELEKQATARGFAFVSPQGMRWANDGIHPINARHAQDRALQAFGRNGGAMTPIDQLAATSQQPPQAQGDADPGIMRMAQLGGGSQPALPPGMPDISKMSDDEIISGIGSGALPLPPALAPQTAPKMTQPAAGGIQVGGPEDQAWAKQQAQGFAILRVPVPKHIEDLSRMGPGGELNPAYKGDVARQEAEGKAPSEINVNTAKQRDLSARTPTTITIQGVEYPVTQEQYHQLTGILGPAVTQQAQSAAQAATQPPQTAAGAGPGAAPPVAAGGTLPIGKQYLTPGQAESEKVRAAEEQKQRQVVITEGNHANDNLATIKNMAGEAGNFVQGPFAPYAQKAASYLRLIDPSFDKPVASYEDFVKNAGTLTRQAVKEVSGRAAVQEFQMVQNSLPNPEMSPLGLERVKNELLGLYDFRLAKAQAQKQWEAAHGGAGNVTDFETTFQKQASPYAFMVGRMAPQDRQELFGKLQGSEQGRQELSRLSEQINFMKQNGLGQY